MDHQSHNVDSTMHDNIKEFVVKDVNGNDVQMSDLVKKVTLIVNIDCKEGGMNNMECKDLQQMYTQFKERGLEVVAFPSAQFQYVSSQGSELPASKVKEDLQKRYNVSFHIMDKVNVNGDSAHPLFMFLQRRLSGFPTNAIKWDFTSFLCVDGTPMKRYAPMTPVAMIEKDISEALGGGSSSSGVGGVGELAQDAYKAAAATAEKATAYAKHMANTTFGANTSATSSTSATSDTKLNEQGGQYSSTTHPIPNTPARPTGDGEGPFPGTPAPQRDNRDF